MAKERCIYIPDELWDPFKEKIELEGKTLSGQIRVWIREYLKEKE